MNRNWRQLINHSSITIGDIEDLITPLCPIVIYFNNKIIWDDTVDADNPLSNPQLYTAFWKDHAHDIVDKYTVDIRDYHHSIIRIWSINE